MPLDPLMNAFLGGFVGLLTSMGSFLTIPKNLISVLNTVTGYGNWIIGEDLVLIIFACVAFWTTQKFAFGLFTFLWENLPLT